MSIPSAIQGHLLEVTVVGCNKLKDTEWISRQDPYVCLEYANQKFRTKTCTDGHKNPAFQEKFVFSLIEGLREINVVVWNSNTVTYDDFIGSGKIQLQKVLSQGYDDTPWPLQSKSGRYAGEVRLIMHYANAKKPLTCTAPSALPCASAPPYPTSAALQVPGYSAPPPSAASMYPPVAAYPAASSYPSYPPPPNPTAYPPSSYPPQPTSYPPQPPSYPPSPYPPPAYPPTTYPPQGYPPHTYPPSQPTPYYPSGTYPPTY